MTWWCVANLGCVTVEKIRSSFHVQDAKWGKCSEVNCQVEKCFGGLVWQEEWQTGLYGEKCGTTSVRREMSGRRNVRTRVQDYKFLRVAVSAMTCGSLVNTPPDRQTTFAQSANWAKIICWLQHGYCELCSESINHWINQSINQFLKWPKWHSHCKEHHREWTYRHMSAILLCHPWTISYLIFMPMSYQRWTMSYRVFNVFVLERLFGAVTGHSVYSV